MLKLHRSITQCPVFLLKNIFVSTSKRLLQKLNFSCSALFHMKTRVFLKYFVRTSRIIHLYFLNVKLQLLGIFLSLFYLEEATIFFSVQDPIGLILVGLGTITPVNNVRLSCNFEYRQSSQFYQCQLNDFVKLEFSQRQDVPKCFGPTLTPIYPMKMTEIKNSHRAIQISQNLKSRAYILSIFNENYNYFLLYLGICRVQMGPRSFNLLSQKPLIKVQVFNKQSVVAPFKLVFFQLQCCFLYLLTIL